MSISNNFFFFFSELRVFRERVQSLEEIREHLMDRCSAIEDENRQLKDDVDEMRQRASTAGSGSGEDDGSAQDTLPSLPGEDAASGKAPRKRRFTRMEMARVLMERNMYKEKLMELQDQVRLVESLRALKEKNEQSAEQRNAKKSGSIWNFFGTLFNGPARPRPTTPQPSIQTISGSLLDTDFSGSNLGTLNRMERSRTYHGLSTAAATGHSGRVEAYGWSIPASSYQQQGAQGLARNRAATRIGQPSSLALTMKPEVPIPIPVCCQPLPGLFFLLTVFSLIRKAKSFKESPKYE